MYSKSSLAERSLGLIHIDTQNLITFVDQNYLDHSGYKESELLELSGQLFNHKQMPHVLLDRVLKHLHDGFSVKLHMPLPRKLGEHSWAYTVLKPSANSLGQMIGTTQNFYKADDKAVELFKPLYENLMNIEKSRPKTEIDQALNALISEANADLPYKLFTLEHLHPHTPKIDFAFS